MYIQTEHNCKNETSETVTNYQPATKIAVLMASDTNRALLSRLLFGGNLQFFDQHESLTATSAQFDVLILCDERMAQLPITYTSLKNSPARIIVLSKSTHENVIANSLYAGAHHFFNILESERVLKARIDASIRKHLRFESQVLKVNPYTFELGTRTVRFKDQLLDLSPREFELAHYLFSNRHRMIPDTDLMTCVWTLPSHMDTRRIDTAVCRVRHKMNMHLESSMWTLQRFRKKGYQLQQNTLAKVTREIASLSNESIA